MTVGQSLHKTLANMRGAKADLESFALDTQDKNAQKMYTDLANQMEQCVSTLSGRVNYVEQEEPQHKVFQQMQNPDQKPQQ